MSQLLNTTGKVNLPALIIIIFTALCIIIAIITLILALQISDLKDEIKELKKNDIKENKK